MMGLLAILNSLAFIGMEASFPKFVNPNEIPKIQSILQGIDQTSQVMGPAIAASASYFFPVHQLLIIGAILFAISSINMFFLGEKNKTKTISSTDIQTIENKLTIKKLFGSYQRAWLVLCARPILFQFSALTWILNVLYGATLVLVPAIALQVFNKPDHYLGLLQSITAVFSVLSFFLVPKLVEKFDLPGLGLISFSVALIGSFVISFAPNFLVLLIGAIIVHVPDGWFNVYIRSSRSLIIPKDDLGKTIGFIIIMNNGSLPLAGAIISRFSSHYSPQEIFFGFCIVSLVLTLITMMIGKKIFKYSTWMPNVSEVNA